jgi:hypothetical protein
MIGGIAMVSQTGTYSRPMAVAFSANVGGVRPPGPSPSPPAQTPAARDLVSGKRAAWVLVSLGLSWVLFAWPVLRSTTVRDPLTDLFTDHLRYRYCAALTVAAPVHALTTPLGTLYAQDTRPHRVLLWESDPCSQPGVVFLALHAPLQWLLDRELLSEARSTQVYVLFLLAVVHLAVGRLLLSRLWWAGLLVYPFMLRCALYGLQEPIPFGLALFAAFRWNTRHRLSALALATLAFSAYNRWIVWPLGLAWLAWRDRAALVDELRALGVGGRLVLASLIAVFAWSVAGSWLAASAWVPPEGELPRPVVLLLAIYAIYVLLVWWRNQDSAFAPVVFATLAFLLTYRGLILFWYATPLLPAVVLARGRAEKWLWAITPLAYQLMVFRAGLWPSATATLLRDGWLPGLR